MPASDFYVPGSVVLSEHVSASSKYILQNFEMVEKILGLPAELSLTIKIPLVFNAIIPPLHALHKLHTAYLIYYYYVATFT